MALNIYFLLYSAHVSWKIIERMPVQVNRMDVYI